MSGHLRQKHRRIRPRPPNPRCHHLPGSRDARPGWPAPDPALGGQDTPAPGGRIPRRNRRPKEGPVRRCPAKVLHDARSPPTGFLRGLRGILERRCGTACQTGPGTERSRWRCRTARLQPLRCREQRVVPAITWKALPPCRWSRTVRLRPFRLSPDLSTVGGGKGGKNLESLKRGSCRGISSYP